MPKIAIMYMTFPDEASAGKLGETLLQEKLVACFNYFPIQSMYVWQGVPQKEGEIVAITKTNIRLVPLVEEKVASSHPYQTPCILHTEWEANQKYFDWVQASTLQVD